MILVFHNESYLISQKRQDQYGLPLFRYDLNTYRNDSLMNDK